MDTWLWEVSESPPGNLDINNNAHWGAAPGNNNGASYTPEASSVDKFLRVTAMYSETIVGQAAEDRTVRAMTRYAVQADGGGAENDSPDFIDGSVERSVDEDVAVGANVGAPGRRPSTGGTTDQDRLTYSLRAVTQSHIDANASGSTALALPVSASDDA